MEGRAEEGKGGGRETLRIRDGWRGVDKWWEGKSG